MTCSLGGHNDDLWQFVPCPNDGPRQVRKNDSLIWWNGILFWCWCPLATAPDGELGDSWQQES